MILVHVDDYLKLNRQLLYTPFACYVKGESAADHGLASVRDPVLAPWCIDSMSRIRSKLQEERFAWVLESSRALSVRAE